MIEVIAPNFNPPLPSSAVQALKNKLAECHLDFGSVYISQGTTHANVAAVVWVSGDSAIHVVAEVKMLTSPSGAAEVASRIDELAAPARKI